MSEKTGNKVEHASSIRRKELSPMDFINENRNSRDPNVSQNVDDIVNKNVTVASKEVETLDKVVTASETPKETTDNTITKQSIDKPKEDVKEPEIEVKTKIKGNPTTLFAKHYKEMGRLPKDFEVPEDITEDQLDEAIWNHREKNLVSLAEQKLREDLGISDESFQRAKLLEGGVTEQEITEAEQLSVLSTLELDKESEDYGAICKEFLTIYYSRKDLPTDVVHRMVERDLADEDNIDSLMQVAKQDFASQKQKLDVENERKAEESFKNRKEAVRRQRESDISLIKTGKIDGYEYTPEQVDSFIKGYYEKTVTYKDGNGKVIKITPYQQKVLEHKKDKQKVLRQKLDFFLDISSKKIEEKIEKKLKSKFLGELNSFVEVDASLKNEDRRDTSDNSGIVRRAL